MLRADKIIQNLAFNNPQIEFVFDTVVEEIVGEECVKTLRLKNVKNNNIFELNIDGVFPYIGITPNVEYFSGQLEQDSFGFITTDVTMQTSIEGVYAVGDVRNTPLRQVITAVSDGAVGAVYASKYINSQEKIIV